MIRIEPSCLSSHPGHLVYADGVTEHRGAPWPPSPLPVGHIAPGEGGRVTLFAEPPRGLKRPIVELIRAAHAAWQRAGRPEVFTLATVELPRAA